MRIFLTILILILSIASCKEKDSLSLTVLKSQLINNVPSGSGMGASKKSCYVISDDSPYLFKLDSSNQIITKTEIFATTHLHENRILKKYKPDFEALEVINENELIIFGSGSSSPQRDLFLHISLKDSVTVKTYQITSFYNNLRKSKLLKNAPLNIEGVAFYNDTIYLFNRGKNVIFSFIYKDLLAYFNGEAAYPEPKTTLFSLPKINGIESGFSGATILKNKPLIIFTSSVENTGNSAYNDGEILSSFIGTIEMSENKVSNHYKSAPIPNVEKALKVEAVTIVNDDTPEKIEISLVTDDDMGSSIKIDCILKL
jgi:hypothetical protein